MEKSRYEKHLRNTRSNITKLILACRATIKFQTKE